MLEALGVNIELPAEQVGACLDELGLGFCYARLCHQAMKHVAPVRSQLPFRTIFNLLGPLTNPAGAEYQLLGASRPETARLLAGALAQLGRRHALVVCGGQGPMFQFREHTDLKRAIARFYEARKPTAARCAGRPDTPPPAITASAR